MLSRSERKKSHDKVYPKGYVEMLEQQQTQLVTGLQEMYKRLQNAQAWVDPSLPEVNGHPLTHDILAALGLLETKHDGSGDTEVFEEDCRNLQSKLLADGAGLVQRRGSFSSESEHSQHDHSRPATTSAPSVSRGPTFRDSFNFGSASPPPTSQSPVQHQRQSFPPAVQPSPLHQSSPLCGDPQFYQAEWAIPDLSSPEQIIRSRFAMQAPMMQDGLPQIEEALANDRCDTPMWNDSNFNAIPLAYPQQFSSAFSNSMQGGMMDYTGLDAADIEFSQFIRIMA
ncbi:hypothetical protein LTR36_007724 [Oleoguttula mirabilis]|uniref:C6 transcription factor n=1 Tax=Oleoguttula mirabilis TaxID=1507867 RepID=A0AAV9JUM5_9PEZI|nr:hypothetical protein LTR36_007724 [Oleoguttula mirabilis]